MSLKIRYIMIFKADPQFYDWKNNKKERVHLCFGAKKTNFYDFLA